MISILSKFGILVYFLVQIPEVIDKVKTVTYKEVIDNLDNDTVFYTLDETNFDVGLRVTSLGPPIPDDLIINRAKYFKFDIAMTIFYQETVGNQSIS